MEDKNLEYQIFRENLIIGETSIVSHEIRNSKNFELDELSHMVLKGTNYCRR